MNPSRPIFLVALTMLIVAGCRYEKAPPAPAETVEDVGVQSAAVIAPLQALLVVGPTGPLANGSGDQLLRDRLSTQLGYTVTVVDGTSATGTMAGGKALVVISESVTDTQAINQVGTKFKSVATPVLVMEP